MTFVSNPPPGVGTTVETGEIADGSVTQPKLATNVLSLHVVKTADEVVNNSTTLQDDNHLSFAIGVSEKWFFEFWGDVVGVSVNADLKMGWSLPAAASVKWNSGADPLGVGTGGSALALSTTTTTRGLAANESMVFATGFITAGATAGTAQFQWAQNTLTAEDVTLKAGSLLLLRRVV